MGVTLQEARENLKYWLEADKAASIGMSYKIGDRELIRPSIEEIHKSIDYWEKKIEEIYRNTMFLLIPTEEEPKQQSEVRTHLTNNQARFYHNQMHFLNDAMERAKNDIIKELRKVAGACQV